MVSNTPSNPSAQSDVLNLEPSHPLTGTNQSLQQWAVSVPLSAMEETLEQVKSVSDPGERSKKLTALVTRGTAENPEIIANTLYQLAKSLPDDSDDQAQWIDLLKQEAIQWTRTDSDRAVAWVQSLSQGTVRSEVMGQISSELVSFVSLFMIRFWILDLHDAAPPLKGGFVEKDGRFVRGKRGMRMEGMM